MKKRGSLLKYLLTFIFVFGIAFLARIPKAYADTKHDFSFKIYNCYSLDESKLQDTVNPETNKVSEAASFDCAGPNGDGVTPEITATNVAGVGSVYKIEPGQYIKVGIHYTPGTAVSVGQQAKWTWDSDIELIQLSKYKRSTSTYYYSFEDSYQMGEDWVDEYERYYEFNTALNPTVDNKIAYSASAKQGDSGDPIELEMDVIYFYYKVKDDAATNTPLKFEFDTTPGSGIVMGNGSAYVSHDASLYAEVPLNDDNSLKSITVTNGSTTYPVTPNVTPGDNTQTTYTAYVPNNINSINLAAEANDDPKAILTGQTGNHSNLAVGNNYFTITVTAEDGTPKDYTVNIYKLSNNANLSTLSLTNVDFGNFAAGTTSYTATVPYTTDSTTVSATVADTGKAYLTSGSTGNKDLGVGETPISVTVKAENCKSDYSGVPGNTCTDKTYTVTVTREEPSTVSTLNNLLVDGTRVKGFTPGDGTSTYTLDDVGYSKQTMIITYDKGEDHESVTGDGTKTLVVGDNSFDVVVTAQDGTTKTTYTINVYKKSNNADLSTLTVNSSKGGTLDPDFAANKINYTYSVDADENSVDISYTLAHEHASATSTPANLTGINPQNTSSVIIEVTPEDITQTKKTYTITFDVAKSTNGNLSEITVDNEPIDNFDPTVTEYEITVPSNTQSVVIGAELEDPRGEITGGTGAQPLDYGENEIEITVQPEDPTAEPVTYTVTVIRSYKTDADLLDLKADGVTVPNFHTGDPDKTEYDVGNVASDKETINIDATLSDPSPDGATVEGIGDVSLSVGENRLPVVVTAHDGTTTKTYYVKVKRLNDAKNLATLTITSDPAGTWDKEFTPGETTYTYTTDADEDEVVIAATVPEGSGSTIVSGPGTYDPATTSEVTIVVKAEDNSEKHYVINLVRAESSNANLSNLTIDGQTIDGFDPDITEYTINIPSDKDSITIGAELEDDRASFTGDGEKTGIQYGPNNQFTITVTAEDNTPKVYTINVTRAYKTDDTLTSLSVDGVPVPNFHSTDPDGTEYDLGKVASDKETVLIEATLGDPDDATVTGIGTKGIEIGDNRLPVTITAQDGETSRTYYIKIKRKNNDSSLANLEVVADTQGSLDKDFDPTITEYTYTSDPDEDEVSINVTLPDGATVSGIDNPYNPQDGADVTITVTPEDGSAGVTIYTVHIVRGKATNANLDELGVIGYELDPDFSEDEDHYTVNVPSDVDKVIITAHAADAPRAEVSGTGEKDVEYGSQVFTVEVTADDPTVTKPYYVTVIRALNDNVKLEDLKVNDESIDGFDPDEPAYNYGTVGNDVTSLDIVGYPAADNATAETSENAGNLIVGENTITITVTAQNGAKGYYTVTVTREGSSNNYLDSLEVEGYDLDKDFDKEIENYSITVPSDVDEVTVNAVAEDEDNATVTIEGNDNLQPGENTITITVEAENGEEKVYTITVTKEEEPEDDEKITSQIRIIADGMIKDVVYKTLPEGLKDQCDNDNDKLFIYDMEDENEIDNNQQLGTGMIIKLIKNDRENDRDIIVVKGEVTGDGEVRINDVVRAVSAYVGAEELTGPWFEACDIATDGEIRINDVVSIVNLYVSE